MKKQITSTHFLPLIAFLVLLSSFSVLQAQSVIEKSASIAEITIGLQLGASYNITTGKAKKGLDDYIKELEATAIEYTSFTGEIKPNVSVILGATVNYQWKENMSFNTGLTFQRRGYTIVVDAEEINPDFQYDQFYDYKEKYRLSTLEVPLSVGFSLGNRLKFSPGVSIGFGLENSSKIKYKSDQEVIVNGEREDELSLGADSEKRSYTDLPKGTYFGLLLEASCRVSSKISLAAAAQRVGPYANLDYGKLSDYSLSFSLIYDLTTF